MRILWIPLIASFLISILVDTYIYRRLADSFRGKIWISLHLWISVGLYIVLACAIALPRKDGDNAMLLTVMWALYSFLSVYIAKAVYVIADMVCRRLWRKKGKHTISIASCFLGLLAFATMWWGALINRYCIDVRDVDLCSKNLPESFDGYRIVQISDLHLGTYGNDTAFVSHVVDTINSMTPDLIVFTGDIVNSRTLELEPHVIPLSRLKARDGVLSILGNHDYGDYANWQSQADKGKNIQHLKDLQASMGWTMLNNDTRYLSHGSDTIAVIGVENIGDPPFHVYGSLSKAYPTLGDSLYKILLSHNPAHWVDSISEHRDVNINLTLSGHTHAMQIKIAGHSPAAFRYRTWGGLYTDTDSLHKLYVNIGLGTVGFPARIGATPEITVITLRNK